MGITNARWLALLLSCGALAAAEFTLVEESPGETYRVGAVALAPVKALAGGVLRILLDRRDADSYYALELTNEAARFVRVEAGQATPIGLGGTIYRGRLADRLEIAVQRQEWSLTALVNRVVCARAEDRTLPPGAVGHEVTGAGLRMESCEVQPTEAIYFADDFMRADEQLGGWQSLTGRWENNQQGSKTSRSANAFSFRSVGEVPSLAVVGYPFWADYNVQAAVRCDGDGAVGLAVGVHDAANGYRLRWTAATNPDGGTCRLQRVFDGQVADIAPVLPGGFRAGVWYKLQLALSGGRLLAWIDDVPCFEVAVQAFGEGRIGLYTEPGPTDTAATGGALFDDVVVRSWPLFVDDFSHSAPTRWVTTGAPWRLSGGPAGVATASGDGALLSGAATWDDVQLEALWKPADGEAGLVVHRAAAGHGYELRCGATGAALIKRQGGQVTVLDQVALAPPNDWTRLSLSYDQGLLRARVGDATYLEGFDLDLPAGRAGLFASAANAAFDQVRATFAPAGWTLPPSLPADFVNDEYMVNWASPSAAWMQVEGSPARWHKGFFYGDRRIECHLPAVGKQAGEARIILGAASPTAPDPWQLDLQLATQAPPLTLTLRRGDQVLAKVTPQVTSEAPSLIFELRGPFILVWLDGQNVLHHRVAEVTP